MQNEYDIKKVMEEIELQLIASMKRTLWSHKEDEKAKGFNWPQWQALKIKQFEDYKKANKEIFNNNTKGLNRYLYKHIKEQFKEGAGRTNKQAIQSGIIRKEDSQLGGSFFGLNHRKLDALIKSTKSDMKDVKYATLRMANDQYRQIIYKAQVFANTGAGTVKQAIDMASKEFLLRGFNCIEYKNGTKHNIADYCDMAIRTANKRANLMGEGEIRKKLGNSLVYISKHGGACDKCTPWEGRVYIDNVWSGGKEDDGEYPLLSTAIEGGLFHPGCYHGVSTYYEGVNDEPEEVTQAKHNHNKEDKYTQYLQQRQKQYQRLAIGSLLPENISNYQNKANELQNQIESSKIKEHNIANGKNIVGKYEVTKEEKTENDGGISRIMKLQGYDGVPRIVDDDEFKNKVKESNFFAQRTYSAKTKEEVLRYQKELYEQQWYVSCFNGGSQYGRGMYCAATYDINNNDILNGIKEEMQHYIGLNKQKRNPIAIIEDFTLDKSAKIIDYDKIKAEYVKEVMKVKKITKNELFDAIDNYENIITELGQLKQDFLTAQYIEKNQELANKYFTKYNKKQIECNDYLNKMPNEIKEIYKETQGIDRSILAIEMGYDAINAKGHGLSGSYTVILNRTKLIIRRGGKIVE